MESTCPQHGIPIIQGDCVDCLRQSLQSAHPTFTQQHALINSGPGLHQVSSSAQQPYNGQMITGGFQPSQQYIPSSFGPQYTGLPQMFGQPHPQAPQQYSQSQYGSHMAPQQQPPSYNPYSGFPQMNTVPPQQQMQQYYQPQYSQQQNTMQPYQQPPQQQSSAPKPTLAELLEYRRLFGDEQQAGPAPPQQDNPAQVNHTSWQNNQNKSSTEHAPPQSQLVPQQTQPAPAHMQSTLAPIQSAPFNQPAPPPKQQVSRQNQPAPSDRVFRYRETIFDEDVDDFEDTQSEDDSHRLKPMKLTYTSPPSRSARVSGGAAPSTRRQGSEALPSIQRLHIDDPAPSSLPGIGSNTPGVKDKYVVGRNGPARVPSSTLGLDTRAVPQASFIRSESPLHGSQNTLGYPSTEGDLAGGYRPKGTRVMNPTVEDAESEIEDIFMVRSGAMADKLHRASDSSGMSGPSVYLPPFRYVDPSLRRGCEMPPSNSRSALPISPDTKPSPLQMGKVNSCGGEQPLLPAWRRKNPEWMLNDLSVIRRQMDENLPWNWKHSISPNGRFYFLNVTTRETTWTDPRLSTDIADLPPYSELYLPIPYPQRYWETGYCALPKKWGYASTKDGRLFFWDNVTRTTTWTDPRIAVEDYAPPEFRGHTTGSAEFTQAARSARPSLENRAERMRTASTTFDYVGGQSEQVQNAESNFHET